MYDIEGYGVTYNDRFFALMPKLQFGKQRSLVCRPTDSTFSAYVRTSTFPVPMAGYGMGRVPGLMKMLSEGFCNKAVVWSGP
jgi:hypothetical protein